MDRAYYDASVADFLAADADALLGELTRKHNFALEETQRSAWVTEIRQLRGQMGGIAEGWIFFEFSIPRIGKRADVVVLYRGVVFVLEYKVGSDQFSRDGLDQVLDYALDLKNFHEGSHRRPIVPILICTAANPISAPLRSFEDLVCAPVRSNGSDLRERMGEAVAFFKREADESDLDDADGYSGEDWSASGYRPTPTIIEAAQALYSGHSVVEISRSDAGADNLSRTATFVAKVVSEAKALRRKSICFITGVPGAGKTLAGLNIATNRSSREDENAVFLSGNGPLVDVLREALARDEVSRSSNAVARSSKSDALRRVGSFIQNIHHFRDEGLRTKHAPFEHVVIFDEAQRAWDQEHAAKFMRQKRGRDDFSMSEPEFLIDILDRHEDWCTIVCLIGGGQEINSGEAGLSEWAQAIEKRFSHWRVYTSDRLSDPGYSWGLDLKQLMSRAELIESAELHLAVSMRSFRSESVSEFVGAVIDGDAERARRVKTQLDSYPLAITRDLDQAREWLRSIGRGSERIGLVASSGALRLKPEGIYVKSRIDPPAWFLNDKSDVRSSFALEDVGTEFDVQGLELDWIGVCWDADLRMHGGRWQRYAFKGTKWQRVADVSRQKYLSNAYRVLLTRARQGLVIFVPNGDGADPTRPPAFYDETFEFLLRCGLREL